MVRVWGSYIMCQSGILYLIKHRSQVSKQVQFGGSVLCYGAKEGLGTEEKRDRCVTMKGHILTNARTKLGQYVNM